MERRRSGARLARRVVRATVTLVVAAGAVAPSAAGAAVTTLSVSSANPACSDAGPGTATIPFCSIRKAATVAQAGQTVVVAGGIYAGDISPASSGTAGAPIVFTAAPGAAVLVWGGTSGFRIASRSNIVVNGFGVAASSGPGINVIGSTGIWLVNNRVSYSGKPTLGSSARGIRFEGTSSSVIYRNTTDHNSDAGIGLSTSSNSNIVAGNTSYANARGYTRAAAGIDLRDGAGNVVTGNVTFDNEDSGINVWYGTSGTNVTTNVVYRNGDHGIDVKNAVNTLVVSNTVSGNTDSGIEATMAIATYLANNISTDNGINSPRSSGNIRVDAASAGWTVVDYDLVNLSVPGVMIDWAGTTYGTLAAFQAATGREPHGRQGDPRFAAVGNADFHLLAGSPAIDSASASALGEPVRDADNAARVDDPATANSGTGSFSYYDRGAFEYLPR